MEGQFHQVRDIVRAERCYVTLEVFDKTPKLDFVDCLLYGYQFERGTHVITFDQKLIKQLNEIF